MERNSIDTQSMPQRPVFVYPIFPILPPKPPDRRLRPGTLITDDGVRSLRKMHGLEHLYLDNTAITDECVPYLAQMRGLWTLTITGTRISKPGAETLAKALPRCMVLGPEEE